MRLIAAGLLLMVALFSFGHCQSTSASSTTSQLPETGIPEKKTDGGNNRHPTTQHPGFGPNGLPDGDGNDHDGTIPNDNLNPGNEGKSSSMRVSWARIILLLSSVAAVVMLLLLSFLVFQRRKRVHYMNAAFNGEYAAGLPVYQPDTTLQGQPATSQWLSEHKFHPLHVAAVLNDLSRLQSLLEEEPGASPSTAMVESRFGTVAQDIHTLSPPPLSEASMGSDHSLNDDECLLETELETGTMLGSQEGARSVVTPSRPINVLDYQTRTPLHWAVVMGHTKVIQKLLAHGADPNVQDVFGHTTLHVAVLDPDLPPELLQALLAAGADPNVQNAEGSTPLHLAAACDEPAKIARLLSAAALGEQLDSQGHPPLITACSNGNARAAKALLEDPGLDRESKDLKGKTALHWAAQVNAIPCVQALLSAGASFMSTDFMTDTPLHTALREGNVEAGMEILTMARQQGKAHTLLGLAGGQGQTCQELSSALDNAALLELVVECGATSAEEQPAVPASSKEWRAAYMRQYRAGRKKDTKRGNAQVARVEAEHARLLTAVTTLRQEAAMLRQLLSQDDV
eukprot:m.121363 g.121363  ORF g.121363 m.121363 type:complete len:570 (-) comp15636_c0_seq1:100-1809(-)